MFDEKAKPKGKPKRGITRYRRRWLLLVGVLILLGLAVHLARPRYTRSLYGAGSLAPNSQFFVEIGGAGMQRSLPQTGISDGWSWATPPLDGQFWVFAWSTDSRYVVFRVSNAPTGQRLALFDTLRWQWNLPADCPPGVPTLCTLEEPLATNGRYVLLRSGKMLDLTTTIPPLATTLATEGRVALASVEYAKWSRYTQEIAIVGVDAQGNKAVFIGTESGENLRPLLPLEADFEPVHIIWNGTYNILLTGSVDGVVVTRNADLP